MEFPGFLGNAPVKEALARAFSAGRFPHALLFQGEKGVGKRTLAALTAKALVCREPAHPPCGICPSCIRAEAGSHPDIRIVQGSGVSGALSVDAVGQMLADAYRMPEEAAYNVYIVHLGASTQPAAQNKLLKLIEEPPKSAVFIMLCPTAEAVLPTIRSRAQIFTLRPPGLEEAAEWLCKYKAVDHGRARELAYLCGGNLGRMQEELEGGMTAQAFQLAGEIAAAVRGTGHSLLKAAAPLQKDRALFRETLDRLSLIFRDACVQRAGGASQLSGSPQAVEALQNLSLRRLTALQELTDSTRQKLDRNANTALLLTCYCADLQQKDRKQTASNF